jgi:hypothetical protein
MTMLELGEWIVRHKMDPAINMVIATDGEFPEWSTVLFELKTEGVDHIVGSLEEGIDLAIDLIRRKRDPKNSV